MTEREWFECTVADDLCEGLYRVIDNTVSTDKILEYREIYKKYKESYSSNDRFKNERESYYNDCDVDVLYKKYLPEVASHCRGAKLKNITSSEIKELILEIDKMSDIINKI